MTSTPVPVGASVGSDRLDPAWTEWVAINALRGASDDELVAAVVSGGAEPARAVAEVSEVLRSPILAAARREVRAGSAMARAARLMRGLAPHTVTACTSLDEDTLYREYWTAHRPVVLRGAASGWASAGWTFEDLRQTYRWAPMDVSVRGEGWWLEARQTRRMPFGDFVDAVLGPRSDALYADGRCDVLEQAGLVRLRDDLGSLPGLVDHGHPRAWIGPAGTITPTHHDQSTAWQVVVLGRKRVYLASPLEVALAPTTLGLFNSVDPRDPTVRGGGVRWYCVELGPGDALLMPVGWWHHVEALAPSFSVSFSGFCWANAHPWFVAPT